MNWSKPRRTLESVVDELAEGLSNGSIALRDAEEEAVVESPSEVLTPESISRSLMKVEQEGLVEQGCSGFKFTVRKIPTGDQASISKGLTIKGEIVGTDSLFIDGKVEGIINIPGNRVTIGKNGVVNASISARELIVLGKVEGNVIATGRVDIRAGGSLNGDVIAGRIIIEDSAIFRGGIELRSPDMNMPLSRDAAFDETTRMA